MALSNWDTLAFNTEGKSCNGIFDPMNGTIVEIYKNWAYVHNKEKWDESCGFSSPVIASIHEGYVNFFGIQIIAARGPQNSIFLFVCSRNWSDNTHHIMAGIGGYGYDDNTDRLLKALDIDTTKYKSVFQMTSFEPNGETYIGIDCFDENGKLFEFKLPLNGNEYLESQWTGITKETAQEFFNWLETIYDKSDIYVEEKQFHEWLNKIKNSEHLRFNQGDAFFANMLGEEIPTTEIGKESTPLITTITQTANENIVDFLHSIILENNKE